MSHIDNPEWQAAVAMDLDSLVDPEGVISGVDGGPMPQFLHDQVKPFHFRV
jgi:hypothetical protein